MANQGMGGLYATVNLDISGAMKELDKLDRKMKAVFRSTSTGRGPGAGGLGGLSQSANTATRALQGTGKAATDAEKRTNRLARSFGRVKKESGDVSKTLSGMSNAFSTSLASFGAARSGNVFYALSSGVNALQRGAQAAASSTSLLALGIAGVATAALAGAAAVAGFTFGLVKLYQQTQKSGSNLETLAISFEALLGSASRARAEMEFLKTAAETSPFYTEDIVGLDRFLLAQGLLADDLRQGVVKSLIEFGAAAGLTGDRLRDLGYALGQVYNAGRLTGDEARQLRNNFLGAENTLRTLPRYAEMTGLEIKKAMETGEISSADFFEAFFAYTAGFQGAAAAQQRSLQGLKDTIIDVFQLGLGGVNLELDRLGKTAASPLANVKALLESVLATIRNIDFTPLVASLGALVHVIVGPFTQALAQGGDGIKRFFESTLPRAILFTANALQPLVASFIIGFRVIAAVVKGTFGVFAGFLGLVFGGANGITGAMQLAGKGFILFAAAVLAATAPVVTGLATILAFAKAIVTLFTTGSLAAAAYSFGSDMTKVGHGIASAGAQLVDAWTALSGLKPIQWDDLLPRDDRGKPSDVAGEINEAFPGSGGASGGSGSGGKGGADKAAQDVARAMDTLFQLSQRWFGLRSELERGLLGEDGFTATVQSIASMGKRLIEALQDIPGTGNAIAVVESATERLVDLARKREEVAEALKDADQKLADAVKARDDFARNVRETSLAFANAFKTETETVREFQQFSERGFFYETEQTKQKSFVDSLRERLGAMRDFLGNIKKLRKLGLDEGLLEEMLAAGPEQAGEVAAQLADGGKAMVGEVNTLQDAVTRVADELGEYGADEFYQAGVDTAQAQVDGLTDQLSRIEAAAEEMGEAIFETIRPWAQEMEDAGKSTGSGLVNGLAEGTAGLPDLMGALASSGDIVPIEIGNAFAGVGGSVASGLLFGEGEAQEGVDSFFGNIQGTLDGWYADITGDAEDGGGGIIEGLFDGFESVDILGLLRRFMQEKVVNPVIDRLTRLKDTAIGRARAVVTSMIRGFEERFPGLARAMGLGLELVGGVMDGALDILKGDWDKGWAKIGDAVAPIFQAVGRTVVGWINTWIGWIESLINKAVDGINFLIRGVNHIPGVDIDAVSDVSLARVSYAGANNIPRIADAYGSQPVNVQVYIGDQEITDIVDTQVSEYHDAVYSQMGSGSRP